MRQASVNLQARAEQEEEFISNTLLKKIQDLKKEKVKKSEIFFSIFLIFYFTDTVYQETLVIHYEKEEEFMTNQLSKKMNYLKNEKVELEVHYFCNDHLIIFVMILTEMYISEHWNENKNTK